MKYRKLPVEIEALEFDGSPLSAQEIITWGSTKERRIKFNEPGLSYVPGTLSIMTLEGEMIASAGDFIIRGVGGEHYPCKPDIFAKTYEPVD